MPHAELLAGALILLLQHNLTGCHHAGHQAAGLLERLADQQDLDRGTRTLCEQMSQRLTDRTPGTPA